MSKNDVMYYGRDKIITDVTLKLALIDQLTQLKVLKLLTFDLCPELVARSSQVSWINCGEKCLLTFLAIFNKNGRIEYNI